MQQKTFPLWRGRAPGARSDNPDRDIPSLTTYLPRLGQGSGASIIICPGGGYSELAEYEGQDYALWLSERGIAAFVLKYRLGSHGYRHPIITGDISRAVRYVRANAPAWGLDHSRIGVMGSSAGGHLVSTLMVHFDSGNANASDPVERISSRPDVGILCYPVISMGPIGDVGTRDNLLGSKPASKTIRYLSSELNVKTNTPPCFLWHTQNDDIVSVNNTLTFGAALTKAKVPMSMHIYPSGPHGIGLGVKKYQIGDKRSLHPWTRELDTWLLNYGFSSI